MKKKGNLFLYVGGAISGIMTALIILGFFWTPYSPTAMDSSAKFQPPSAAHIMGTDNFGRDIFSRVLDGAGDTFIIALCVVAIGCVFGILIGSICGYVGGVPDLILTRVCDSITAFPSFLLALVIVSILGKSTSNIVLALGILFIPSFARTVRGEYARCRELNYIKSARLTGAGPFRIMFAHILPNTFSVLFTAVTIGFNNAVLSEASMSFLGIGIQPPDASLGSMLSDSQTYLRNAPWYAMGTGLVIILLILGFSLLSEGLQRLERRG